MLRSVEITAHLVKGPGHLLFWKQTIELALDCFVCERTRRTTLLEGGAERAVCTSDEQHGQHYTAAQISAFDPTETDQSTSLRTVVDFWWAPFHDAERGGRASPLSRPSWVRLKIGYFCSLNEESGEDTLQSNLVRPAETPCRHCGERVATGTGAPSVRLLS
ncbi:hypothetical protein [Pseudonocardia sp. TRM90224]|uniref:hypothetical protein n=1 Tax=Pseudonocardia sp. TRM90224 TaxID=2812678 RepID=UPI001E3017AC|nr:hypothetical protein [Pseudonocardia sp. TRM90224]